MISLTDKGIDVPIGEQLNYYGVAVEAYNTTIDDCTGCCFDRICKRDLMCSTDERIDNTMIKFKTV